MSLVPESGFVPPCFLKLYKDGYNHDLGKLWMLCLSFADLLFVEVVSQSILTLHKSSLAQT